MNRQVSHILWDPIMAEKGGYKHFMLKEIYEQPRAVRDTTLGRVGQETGQRFSWTRWTSRPPNSALSAK